MVSYVTATRSAAFETTPLGSTLVLRGEDEVIVEEGGASLAAAYNRGRARARNEVVCFVHDDVAVRDTLRLRMELLRCCTDKVGLVGVIGTTDPHACPWWNGLIVGSVVDARRDEPIVGLPGDRSVVMLDGLLLATRQPLVFDEAIPGFHFYDADACLQMLARLLPNYCLPGGAEFLTHHTGGPTDVARINGWPEAMAAYRAKWGPA